jgi:hypothetical protein
VSIGIQHVRNFNLPDDVFEDGEKKPQKKSAAKGAANNKKRGPSEVFMHHHANSHCWRRCPAPDGTSSDLTHRTNLVPRKRRPLQRDSNLQLRPRAEQLYTHQTCQKITDSKDLDTNLDVHFAPHIKNRQVHKRLHDWSLTNNHTNLKT